MDVIKNTKKGPFGWSLAGFLLLIDWIYLTIAIPFFKKGAIVK